MAIITADFDELEATEKELISTYDDMINQCKSIEYYIDTIKDWKSVENYFFYLKCSVGLRSIKSNAADLKTISQDILLYRTGMQYAQGIMTNMLNGLRW